MRDTFHHPSSARRYAPPTCGARLRAHLRRAFGRDRNPLCRPVDRLRSRVVLGGLLLAAVAAALCWYPALVVQRHEEAAASRTARHDHQVQAAVLAPSTASSDPQPFGYSGGYDTRIGWTYPAGRQHETVVTTPGALAQSARIPLWVDDTGALTVAPRSGGEIALDAAWAGMTAVIGVAAGVGLVVTAVDRAVARGARRAWGEEWATIEPSWSGRA